MADRKRWVIGDALAWPSEDWNYYRDMFLLWPFMLGSIGTVSSLFVANHNYRFAAKAAVVSSVLLLLVREKFLMIIVTLGFVSVQSLWSFCVKGEWLGLAVGILSGVSFFLLIRALADHKLSYKLNPTAGKTVVDLFVGMSSLGFALLIFHYWFHP